MRRALRLLVLSVTVAFCIGYIAGRLMYDEAFHPLQQAACIVAIVLGLICVQELSDA